uniref:Uncharacterized protein n=1 Tax=viral metagenome TaxID=1070528 RepID=A0A6C0B1E2_9ZZZZ
MLVKLLILFFICLLIYQIILAWFPTMEGMESDSTNTSTSTYQDYDTKSDPLILAQQNAGNIEYLKQQITTLLKLDKQVQDISGNVTVLNDQVAGLAKAQADASQQLVGSTPLTVSGTQPTA